MTILSRLYASSGAEVLHETVQIDVDALRQYLTKGWEDVEATTETGERVTFIACGMDVALPARNADGTQDLKFAISNITGEASRAIGQALAARQQMQLTYRKYVSSDLSAPAEKPYTLTVKSGHWSATEVQIVAGYMNVLDTAWPRHRYTLSKHPPWAHGLSPMSKAIEPAAPFVGMPVLLTYSEADYSLFVASYTPGMPAVPGVGGSAAALNGSAPVTSHDFSASPLAFEVQWQGVTYPVVLDADYVTASVLLAAINDQLAGGTLTATVAAGVLSIAEAGSPFAGGAINHAGLPVELFGPSPATVPGVATVGGTPAQAPRITLAYDSATGTAFGGLPPGPMVLAMGRGGSEYAAGLVIDSSRTTVSYGGIIYAPDPGALPFTTDAEFDPGQWRVVQGVVASDLGAASGSGFIGFQRPDADAVELTLQTLLLDSYSVRHAGAIGGGVADDTLAFQRAIDWIAIIALATANPHAVPAIVVPGGKYRITDTLKMFPWIHLVSDGPVVLDFTGIAADKPGIVCDNSTSLAGEAARYSGNHSPFLDGQRGTIMLHGPGKTVSTASAIKMGNFSAGLNHFRDARISNVVITGWNAGQEFGNYDTYLCWTENCRIEQNNYAILAAGGVAVNSGERMDWVGCTLAGSVAAVMHNQTGFDANFYGCSFDFNEDVLKLGATANYCSIRFEHCYFEAFANYIVDGAAAPVANNQLAVFISDAIVLGRAYDSARGVNSPSRTMFRGRYSLSISGIKLRYESRPYLEDGFLIDPLVNVVEFCGYHVTAYQGPPLAAKVINPDSDFQRDSIGTAVDAMSYWEVVLQGGTVLLKDLISVDGKKVMRLVGGTGAPTTFVTVRSKRAIPAEPGDILMANLCVNAAGATGAVNVIAQVEYFSDMHESLGLFPSFATYSVRDAINDPLLPNYALGANRWLDTHGYRAVAPPNTAYGKMRFAVATFDGTVYVSRARLWRG